VRILVWNLLHGGGRRLARLASAIAAHDADLSAPAHPACPRSAGLPLLHEERKAGISDHSILLVEPADG
jgi:hypothetical protein